MRHVSGSTGTRTGRCHLWRKNLLETVGSGVDEDALQSSEDGGAYDEADEQLPPDASAAAIAMPRRPSSRHIDSSLGRWTDNTSQSAGRAGVGFSACDWDEEREQVEPSVATGTSCFWPRGLRMLAAIRGSHRARLPRRYATKDAWWSGKWSK